MTLQKKKKKKDLTLEYKFDITDSPQCWLLTGRVGTLDGGFTPGTAAVILVGADPKLVGRLRSQVVDDRVTRRARLIDPLPVFLPVANSVETTWKQETKGPQGSILCTLDFFDMLELRIDWRLES